MTSGKYTLRNYRCFSSEAPAHLSIQDGFTSFIGPNNSGKSTLIKSFYELRSCFQQSANYLSSNPVNFVNNTINLSLPSAVLDPFELVNDPDGKSLEFEIELDSDEFCIKKIVWKYSPDRNPITKKLYLSDGTEVNKDFFNHTQPNDETHFSYKGKNIEFRAIGDLVGDMSNIQYLGPFRNAINEGSGNYYDLSLGTAFINQWHQWKTGAIRQQNTDIINVTNDIRRLIGANSLEINASNELKTLQIIINGRPHKLSELGSGIAQLIIVLGNSLIRKPSFIAIDEPETNLHPGLQLDFLTSLASYAKRGIMFTTHSIGLAKSISEQIYTVQKTKDSSTVRIFDKTPKYAEFLGSLGITGLREFGWNTILLVEGPEDVRSLEQILRKYKLDRKTVILPLGGSSMINGKTGEALGEIVKLGKKIYAIVDSEKKSQNEKIGKQIEAFKQNCNLLGIKCLITSRRALENYISSSALDAVYGQGKYVPLTEYALPSIVENAFWGKSENWRLFKSMSKPELDLTDIGQFINEIR